MTCIYHIRNLPCVVSWHHLKSGSVCSVFMFGLQIKLAWILFCEGEAQNERKHVGMPVA